MRKKGGNDRSAGSSAASEGKRAKESLAASASQIAIEPFSETVSESATQTSKDQSKSIQQDAKDVPEIKQVAASTADIHYIDPIVVLEKNPLENINTPIFENSIWLNRTGQKKKAGVYPTKRWGHTSVVYEKFLYIYGGCGKQYDSSKITQVFRLDCETYEWEALKIKGTVMPDTRDSHTANIINHKMWIFGGSNSDFLFNEFWTFDLQENEWVNQTQSIKGELPSSREGHASAVLNDRYLIIIGGFNSEIDTIYQDVYLIDTKNKVSKNIGTIRMSLRESQSVSVIEDCIYLFGGQGQNEEYYSDLHRLKIENIAKNPTLNVEEIKTHSEFTPSCRSSHQSVAFQNRYLFVICGEKGEIEPNNLILLSDIWVYDTRMCFWHEIKPRCAKGVAFKERICFSASIYKDMLIVFGGMQSQTHLLEDVMVLHLRDDAKSLLAEERNQCSFCDSVYGLSLNDKILQNNMLQMKRQQDLASALSKSQGNIVAGIDFPLKHGNGEDEQQQPRLSLPFSNSQSSVNLKSISTYFLKSLTSMVSSPFQAISMLTHFLFSLSETVLIQTFDEPKSLRFSESHQGVGHRDFAKYMTAFSQTRILSFDETNKEREPYIKENLRMATVSEFANSIKIAGGKLGDQLILQSRHLNTVSVGVMNIASDSQSNSTNDGMIEIIFYSYDEQCSTYLTEQGEQMKARIDELIPEDCIDFKRNDNKQGVSIRIRALNQQVFRSVGGESDHSELLFDKETNDILCNAFLADDILSNLKGNLQSSIDFSFKTFAKYYYLDPSINQNRVLLLNDEIVPMQSYLAHLGVETSLKKVILSETATEIGDMSLFTMKDRSQKQDTTAAAAVVVGQGCLAYFDNRLMFRFGQKEPVGIASILRMKNKIKSGKQVYLVSGALSLGGFLKPNLVQSAIENPYFQEVFDVKVSSILREIEGSRKNGKSKNNKSDSIHQLEPSPKKIQKINESANQR